MADEGTRDQPVSRVPGRPEPPRRVTPPSPPPGSRPISVEITPRHIRLTPGQIDTATVTIRYHGSVVDELTLRIGGEAAGWTRVAPDSLNIYPDTSAQATIRFAPPRAPRPFAGLIALDLAVTSSSDPGASATQQASIEIEPYDELTAIADGPTSLIGTTEAVLPIKLRNLGNRAADVALAVSSTPAASVVLSTANLTIEPGGEAAVWTTVRPYPQPAGAAARLHPFTVSVSSRYSPPITIDARMEQPAGLAVKRRGGPPIALVALLGAVLVAGVLGGLYLLNGLGGGTATPGGPTATPAGPTSISEGQTSTPEGQTQPPTARPTRSDGPTPTTEPPTATPPPATSVPLVDYVAPHFWTLRSDVRSKLFDEAGLIETLGGRFAFDPQAMRASWAFARPDGTSYIRCAGSVDPSNLTVVPDEARFFGFEAPGELDAISKSLCGFDMTNNAYERFSLDTSFVTGGDQDVLLLTNDPWSVEMDWAPEGPSIPEYSVCAIELAVCFYGGTADVAFGAAGHYNYLSGIAAGSCTAAIFGDPWPNVTKACYYRLTP